MLQSLAAKVISGLVVIFLVSCGTSDGVPATGNVTLSWLAPTENEDGSNLDDLGGYKVYLRINPGDYTEIQNLGNITTTEVKGLPTDTNLYFVVTAIDTSGNESAYSNEVHTIIKY